MINNVVLVGRLTRDAELSYTPSNQALAVFTIAANRKFKNPAGVYEADFINCIIWGHQAEILSSWTKKGMMIGVTGRLQTRSYKNKQGKNVYVTEVVVDSFSLLESRKTAQTSSNVQEKPQGYQTQDLSQPDPLSGATIMDIDDADLPF